jgi:hypothetical protein
MSFFTTLSPWILYLFLANGNIQTVEVETLQQCLNHGRLLAAVAPDRFSIKGPVCLPYQEPRLGLGKPQVEKQLTDDERLYLEDLAKRGLYPLPAAAKQ